MQQGDADADVWQVNLLPSAGDQAAGRWHCYAPVPGSVFDHDVAELLHLAAHRWPGRVLDVVDPQGITYMVCAAPPWYPLPAR